MAGRKVQAALQGGRLAARRIGREDVRLALRMLAGGVEGEIPDTGVPGLSLRVRKRTVS